MTFVRRQRGKTDWSLVIYIYIYRERERERERERWLGGEKTVVCICIDIRPGAHTYLLNKKHAYALDRL